MGIKYIVVKTGKAIQDTGEIIRVGMSTGRAEDMFRRPGFISYTTHELTCFEGFFFLVM